MKRLLELTDGLNSVGSKEYVDVDSITNIMPYFQSSFFGTKTLAGSVVSTGNAESGTYVKETPDKIIEMIKNQQFALVY